MGNATGSGSAVTLTQDVTGESGACWNNTPINLSQAFTMSFNVYFGANTAGADGIDFVLQAQGLYALSVNGTACGSCKGYSGADPITPSVALCIETYPATTGCVLTPEEDGVATSTCQYATSTCPYTFPSNLMNNATHTYVVSWNPATTTLTLTVDGTTVLTYVRDLINDVFGGQTMVYYGFTGATGASASLQYLNVIPGTCNTPTPTPVCTAPQTVGTTTQGGTASANLVNDMAADEVTLSSASTFTGMAVYMDTATAALGVLGIYSNNAGAPGTLIAESDLQNLAAGWNNFTIPPTDLTAGTYWLAFYLTGTTGEVASVATGGTSSTVAVTGGPFNSMQPSFGAGTAGTVNYSIYAFGCLNPTPTVTNTPSSTPTNTSTITPTPTITLTPTPTTTGTWTPTATLSPTNTPTITNSPTNSFTATYTPTDTPTATNTPTDTTSITNTPTDTYSITDTPTNTSTITNTPTSTGTITNTPTNTYTITNTPTTSYTITNTPTSSSSITNTPSSTSTVTNTSTASPTVTATATPTYSPTVTPTATQPVVQVSKGPSSPNNQTVAGGATNVIVMQLNVKNTSGEPVQLNQLDLTAGGTGNNATGIVSVSIWIDNSGSGSLSGATLLATVNSPFSGGNNVLLNLSGAVLGAGASQNYLITYNFSNNPAAGTYSDQLANAAALSGMGAVSDQNIQVTGAPIQSAVVTILQATSTPTATPTATGTPTATPTPVEVIIVGPPYPNPPPKGSPISLNVYVPGPSIVDLSVFTTAFRKVWENSVNIPAGETTVHWNLKDKSGVSVANGLYYLRVRITGIQSDQQIFKVLVIQ